MSYLRDICIVVSNTYCAVCFVLLVVLSFLYYNLTTLIDRVPPFVICGCAVHSVG